MALADIYVLDDAQSFNGEAIHNLYTFERSTTGTATDLINAFVEDLLPLIRGIQHEAIRHETIKAYSLGNLGDLDERTINLTGLGTTGDMLPVFNAVNFSFKPASRAVRAGSKRISGVPESAQVNGMLTLAGYIDAANALRTAYGNPISDDDLAYFEPVVVKRIAYDVPDSDPVRVAYRYPEAGDPLVTASLRAVTLNLKVSHQVSRGN